MLWTLPLSPPGAVSASAKQPQGERYVTLSEFSRNYRFRYSQGFAKEITLERGGSRLTFEGGSRRADFDGTIVWLSRPVMRLGSSWAITQTDIITLIEPLLWPQIHLRSLGYKTVILDPGHGGEDAGALGARGSVEKRVALDLSRRVRRHLRAAGIRVFMTRDSDQFIELKDRALLARRTRADAFVSIHLNSASSSSASGMETYALAIPGYPSTSMDAQARPSHVFYGGSKFNGANALLSYHIQRKMVGAAKADDRGVKRARFVVLKEAPCPAALVECGFLSNTFEERRVLSSEYREKIAQGIAGGILDYINLVRRAQVSTSPLARRGR